MRNYLQQSLSFIRDLPAITLLRRSGLFSKLPLKELISLARRTDFLRLSANSSLFREGDKANFVYVVASGTVTISTRNLNGDDIILANLKKNTHFGEQAFLTTPSQCRNAHARASQDTTLLRLSGDDFKCLLQRHPSIHHQLVELGHLQLVERLARTIDLLNAPQNAMYESFHGQIKEYSANQIIFKKNDTPDFVYYIISGTVNIQLDNTNTEPEIHLKAGQLFGELGILNKQPRAGTASTLEDSKLLVIHADTFLQLYDQNPKCRDFILALNQVYKTPKRGHVYLQHGQFLDMKTETCTFYLPNKRIVTASQVLNQQIFTMTTAETEHIEPIRYEKANIIREIIFAKNKLLGVTAYGYWRDIGNICGMILDEIPITADNISQFKRTGELHLEKSNPDEHICQCAAIKKIDLIHLIESGETNLNALCDKTGAGKICGSCRPSISELMGKSVWSTAYIYQCDSLNPHIKLYKIKLRDTPVADFLPGQHIVMQIYMDRTWVERSYTLISRPKLDNFYEIAIKEEPLGGFSPWLFKHDKDELLMRISPPQGDFIFDLTDTRPAVFLAGGIGVTPAIAFIRAIASERSKRILHLDYSAHDENAFLFQDELKQIANTISNISLKQRITLHEGRISSLTLSEYITRFQKPLFYVCGNEAFNATLSSALQTLDVPLNDIKVESFQKKKI